MRDAYEATQLAGLFYEGILQQEGWREALKQVAHAMDSEHAIVVVRDKATQRVRVDEQYNLPQGLVDEFFLTIAPRVVGGASARVVHGPGAETDPWDFVHGFLDQPGYLFLRYARPVAAAAGA